MSKAIQQYGTAELSVTFDPNLCTHSGNCVKGLPRVFNLKNKPWIQVAAAEADAVVAQVGRCPSGALKCSRRG